MTVYFENENGAEFDFSPEELAGKVIDAVLDYEDCPYEAEVSLTVTGDEEIRAINRDQRGIDAATDVLSFPMTQYPQAGDFAFLEEAADAFHPESGELMLGDIVISADHVRRQAREYGHSELREFAFLTAHSMLHLIGYDHMEPQEAAVMEEKQEAILNALNITREVQ